MFSTDKLIRAVLARHEILREHFHNDHGPAIELLEQMGQHLTYCYRDLREIRSASAIYLEYRILVSSLAGRTMVTVWRGEDEYVSFLGASDGIGIGAQGLKVNSLSSLHQFKEAIAAFAEICTPEVFMEDHGLAIA